MKRHLNTLFVNTDGSYLAKQGEAVAVRYEKKVQLRVPLHNLEGIVCFGRVSASTALMAACAESGVALSFLSGTGRLQAKVSGFTSGNVLMRRAQYVAADDPKVGAELVRSILLGKLTNCRTVVLRAARDANDAERQSKLEMVGNRLSANITDVKTSPADIDVLRGYEGEAAVTYFGAFNDLISVEDEAFRYTSRSRRPPLDPLNAMLSFLYSLLMHDARSACETVGLDPQVGFLHRDRPGRPGLALDLIEEFRPVLADRLVLSLINRRQVSPDGFTKLENGAVLMGEATRKTVLKAWQTRKQETLTHLFLQEKCTIGVLVHLQARLLSRHLRGDLDAYPPFFWK